MTLDAQHTLRSYLRSNETVRDEVDEVLRVAEGALPDALRGVLYRNGPGKMEVFGTPYDHPFDGDGMVLRFAFEAGRVRYRNRYVRTAEYVAEARARKMLYRSFGTNLPGGLGRNFLRTRFKNTANTSVILHGGKLLALWEGGLPHRLDPVTLATLGPDDLDGALRTEGSALARFIAPFLPFSAHPKRDVEDGALHNFGTLYGAKNQLVSYRVSAEGRALPPRYVPLDRLSFVHDFVLTRNYAVYFLSPVAFDVGAALLGRTSPAASLRPRSAQADVLLVPRDGAPPFTIPARAGFVFHFANGYDDGAHVVLDAMRMDTLPPHREISALLKGAPITTTPTVPTRYVIDVRARTVEEHPLSESLADLPTIDPRFVGRDYRHFWSISGAPGQTHPFFHRVLHFEHGGREVVRDFGMDLPGEPLFVPTSPSAAEGDGFVLTVVYRMEMHRSDLYVLRASDLSTVCRLELPHHVPVGFHGTWVGAT